MNFVHNKFTVLVKSANSRKSWKKEDAVNVYWN